ncbi:MAG TPA: HAD family hydrolase [Candidatus Hydrogenedentes bacterium]|nr:HAD family hydrolase [Candidatus Hydrogenedentota bacterium]HOJ68471.1 HAD family hydrolase [Candidatus Hydrogenedentota bacterium]HOK88848.1 HAD family hydrolase [Candidatus Hydrogenedentota bacterium]
MSPLILFDYDGVIADTRGMFQRAFREACAGFGLERLAEEDAFLQVFEDNMLAGLSSAGLREPDIPVFLGVLEQALNQAPLPPVFDGMTEVIRVLHRRFPLWIITSNVSAVIRPVLEQAGIASCFREIMGADVHPKKVEKIRCVRASFPETTPAWYVGDTLGDLLEGSRAGCHTIAVTWGWHDRERLRRGQPARWVEEPSDLLRVFGVDT